MDNFCFNLWLYRRSTAITYSCPFFPTNLSCLIVYVNVGLLSYN